MVLIGGLHFIKGQYLCILTLCSIGIKLRYNKERCKIYNFSFGIILFHLIIVFQYIMTRIKLVISCSCDIAFCRNLRAFHMVTTLYTIAF